MASEKLSANIGYGNHAIKMSGNGTLNGSLYSNLTKANIDIEASGKI